MSHQIPCPNCHTLNALGSKFCNNCGTRLPPSTKIICPHCKTPNPHDRFYCDNCGKRLVEENLPKEEPKPEKASPKKFSLPERDPNALPGFAPGGLPDWTKSGEAARRGPDEETGENDLPSIEEVAPLRKSTDELPTWLVDNVYSSAPPFEPPKEITTDHFLELLRAENEEDDLPDEMAQAAAAAQLPDWLSDVVSPQTGQGTGKAKPAQPSPQQDEPEEWLTQLGPARADMLEDDAGDAYDWGQAAAEGAGWLDELGPAYTGELGDDDADDERPSGILKTSEFADHVFAGEHLPDWLQELGPPQTGELAETPPPSKQRGDEPPISGIFTSDEFADQVRQALGTDDVPDWLKELGPTETAPLDETAVPNAGSSGDIREWMTQIGPPSSSASTAGAPDFDALQHTQHIDESDDDSIYDWLKKPIPDETSDPESGRFNFDDLFTDGLTAEVDAGGDLPDWLSEFGATPTDTDADEPADMLDSDFLQAATTHADTEPISSVTGDWLAELDFADSALTDDATDDALDSGFFQAADVSDEEPISSVTSDWLDELADLPEDDDETPGSGFLDTFTADDTANDWLSELGPAHTAELDDSGRTDRPFTGRDQPDTLQPTSELPDWLTELGPPQTNVFSTPSPGDTEPPDLGASDQLPDLFGTQAGADAMLPDWLSFAEDEDEPVVSAVDEQLAPPADEPLVDLFDDTLADDTQQVDLDPEWLAEITSLGEDALTGALEPPATVDDTAVPPKSTKAGEEPSSIPPGSSADFEDFFTFTDEEGERETAAAADALDEWLTDETIDEADVPEWLSQLGRAATESDSGLLVESQDKDQELIVEDLPEWLSHMRPDADAHISSMSGLASPESLTADAFEDIPAELIGADLPDWLENVTRSSFITEGGAAGAASEEIPDIPDWLKQDGADVLGEQEAEITNQLSALLDELPPARNPLADLAKAEIPDWIRAMKPKERTSEPTAPERPLQTSGPLAGIRGVVEIEPVVAAPYVSKMRPIALAVTPDQQQQMLLLQQLRYDTTPAVAIAPAAATGVSILTRTLLTLLLIGAILAGLFGPNLLRDTAATPPASLTAVYDAVQAAAGQPVLVAFEYTPAMSAELTPQANLLLTQLAANDSPILLVSQYATGIAQARNQDQVYVPGTPFFIPGEAIGLRELANCLREPCAAIAGHLLESDLQQTLTSVSLIIVLTGERDSLVNWIEQVGTPQVGTPSAIPMLVGIPQALQPVVTPYVASKQVSGVIGGLPETAVYAQTYQPTATTTTSAQLNAQHLAQILVLVFLIIGGVSASFTRPTTPSKSKKQQS